MYGFEFDGQQNQDDPLKRLMTMLRDTSFAGQNPQNFLKALLQMLGRRGGNNPTAWNPPGSGGGAAPPAGGGSRSGGSSPGGPIWFPPNDDPDTGI